MEGGLNDCFWKIYTPLHGNLNKTFNVSTRYTIVHLRMLVIILFRDYSLIFRSMDRHVICQFDWFYCVKLTIYYVLSVRFYYHCQLTLDHCFKTIGLYPLSVIGMIIVFYNYIIVIFLLLWIDISNVLYFSVWNQFEMNKYR